MTNSQFKILSLSGGGARGIFQAEYLRLLQSQFENPLYKEFDLIAGTSTGAIIALAYALDINADRVVDFYKTRSSKIFTRKRLSGFTKGPLYDQKPLKDGLKEVFENKQLRDAKTKLIVTASCVERYTHKIFAPFINDADNTISAVDAALSSSAAPTYFPPVQPSGQTRTYLDGGLWANSPSLIAVLYAYKHLDIPLDSIKVVSVGTGYFPSGELSKNFSEIRPYSIKAITSLLSLMFAAQEASSDDGVKNLLGESKVLQINPQLKEVIELDDSDNALAILPALAEHEAESTSQAVIQFVCKHEDNSEEHFSTTFTPSRIGVEILTENDYTKTPNEIDNLLSRIDQKKDDPSRLRVVVHFYHDPKDLEPEYASIFEANKILFERGFRLLWVHDRGVEFKRGILARLSNELSKSLIEVERYCRFLPIPKELSLIPVNFSVIAPHHDDNSLTYVRLPGHSNIKFAIKIAEIDELAVRFNQLALHCLSKIDQDEDELWNQLISSAMKQCEHLRQDDE